MTKDNLLSLVRERIDVKEFAWNYKSLTRKLDQLEQKGQQTERDYFYGKIVPLVLDKKMSGQDFLYALERYAACVNSGQDIEPFIKENLSVFNRIAKMLPNLSEEPAVRQECFRKAETVIAINKFLNTHIYDKDNYIESHRIGHFHNGASDAYYQMPLQGWKMHISAASLEDYRQLLEVALPEFNKQGVIYKVIAPESFDLFANGGQAGKNITVYLNEAFDFSKFSPELQNMLQEQGPPVAGELNLGGRMFARYGRFRETPSDRLVCSHGGSSYDERGACAPPWVNALSPTQILSYAANCGERLDLTGDYKAYAQEMFTMNNIAGHNYLYQALEINPQDVDVITELLEDYKNEHCESYGSAIYELAGSTYIMLHENDKDFATKLVSKEINFIRPDWDFKCNMYFINPAYESLAREMIGSDDKDMSLICFQDGTVALCVDALIKEGSWDFCKRIDFERFGIPVDYILCGQDNFFAIEQNKLETQHIDLTIPSAPNMDGIDWD